MKRVHLFEFLDQEWYPETFRRMQTDYLQFAHSLGSGHHSLVPLIAKGLRQSGTTEIVDLCSGGSGPWRRLQQMMAQAGNPVTVRLTDKFPHPGAVERWARADNPSIQYLAESVDATDVPSHLRGMRTLFEGFHHFRPAQALAILRDAAQKRVAIGVFEATLKPPLNAFLLLLAPLSTLLGYLFMTPFLKPRSLARFLWTYLIPVVPLATCWDGIASMLRVYSPHELRKLAEQVQIQDYALDIGVASTGTPVFDFVYLVGYPT